MIWSSTASGHVTYASPEWCAFTGQTPNEAVGNGWLKCLHPDDIDPTKRSFGEALAQHAPFTFRYRLKHIKQGYLPVVVAATPSFSPIDGSFLGYIGAITEASSIPFEVPDRNIVGHSAALRAGLLTSPTTATDIIADHLLLARATAETAGVDRMLPSLDFAISEIMREIGKEWHATVQ